ncbi:glycosyltransferase family 2 protein [Palleronia sp. LCG004]|uniref:glycosyltransferase family 2 protein n=1 Tax=Palleronia sp. LCG004 TaxID=3079304 RepID=UPI002943B2BC|nr:glycosyltransferase [Palleronia sp. LCG004]WOI55706.1 glycosyltransferase [Palleronia sp. LCG004]
MTDPRVTIIISQRERFGMTVESLESLYEHTSNVDVIYVDGKSPPRIAELLRRESEARGFKLIRRERFLTPNEARNIGVAEAKTDYVVFIDNDVLFTENWLPPLVACADEEGADIVAPLTCQGLPAHTEIHHAGGDYAPGGDMAGFFENNPEHGRALDEVMHGHSEKVSDWQGRLERKQTGMCEFHCALARRDVFDRIGPLDEKLLSTKEHIDFSMSVRQAGGTVWFEPASVVTYVFPCRARPMNREDWPFFALRWSDAYGTRSLEHFITKWNLRPKPDYVEGKRKIYAGRRMQGMLVPMMRGLPFVGKNDALAKKLARASMFPERLVNAAMVRRQDRHVS